MSRRGIYLCALMLCGLVGCNGGSWASGDRVLVAKCLYDTGVMQPHRFDVVVFKYPNGPVEKGTPKNYIKRLLGLPGEAIAIFFGRLYHIPDAGNPPFRKEDENGPDARDERQINPLDLWHTDNIFDNHRLLRKRFEDGEFKMLRKPPDVMMALRRPVFDNDHAPIDLEKLGIIRWEPSKGSDWAAGKDKDRTLSHAGAKAAEVDWLRYRHLVVPRGPDVRVGGARDFKPRLIIDMIGYNYYVAQAVNNQGMPVGGPISQAPAPNWVGDLMLDCNVEVKQAQGEFLMELSKGIYRFQARFDVKDGACSLYRIDHKGNAEKLDSKPSRLRGPGSYQVRFANIDARLTVWVDREMPFSDGHEYPAPEVRAPGEKISEEALLARRGPTENDLEPASLGSQGAAVAVTHLKLWRDTYYTTSAHGPDYAPQPHVADPAKVMPPEAWADPTAWGPLQKQDYRTLYVHPGHYLCLGDNSTASSDSRDWGLVPDRLLLGRALVVYYPIHRIGPIR